MFEDTNIIRDLLTLSYFSPGSTDNQWTNIGRISRLRKNRIVSYSLIFYVIYSLLYLWET